MYYTLTHHGILGQKWGVRRYQNKDGSLTTAGKKHAKEMSDEEFTKNAKDMLTAIDRRDQRDKDISKRREAELKEHDVNAPSKEEFWERTGPGRWDYKLSQKARAYMKEIDEVSKKYDEEDKASYKQWQQEEKELAKKVFNDPRLRSQMDDIHNIRKQMENLFDEMVGDKSKAYEEAYNQYMKDDEEKDDYGFDHYVWRQGTKAYDDAYKAFDQTSKELRSEYNKKIRDAGETVCQGLMDKIDTTHGIWKRTYRQDAEAFIDEYSNFRYEDL